MAIGIIIGIAGMFMMLLCLSILLSDECDNGECR